MKILKNIMLIVALCCFSACSEEELTGNLVDCSTSYVIVDNPDDAVAHRCYQIYEKYQVPVFFRDTLTRTFLGLDIWILLRPICRLSVKRCVRSVFC